MNKKQNKNSINHKYTYKKKNSAYLKDIDKKTEEKPTKINQNNYLYKNKNLKKGIFLKKPKFNEILYPFFLNMKLINEYLKKK